MIGQRGDVLRRATRFLGIFVTQSDFDEDVLRVIGMQFGLNAVDGIGERDGIDGVDEVWGMIEERADFVSLQVTDEVPVSIGEVGEGFAFFGVFLDVIFAEIAQCGGFNGFVDSGGGMEF